MARSYRTMLPPVRLMAWFVKSVLLALTAVGLYLAYSGFAGLFSTWSFFQGDVEKKRGVFAGYRHELPAHLTDPANASRYSEEMHTTRANAFPLFRYTGENGAEEWVASRHEHLFEIFKEDEEVDVWVPSSGHIAPRLGGWYALYFYDVFRALGGLLFAGAALLFFARAASLLAPLESLLQTPTLAPYRAYLVLGLKAVLILAGIIIVLGQIPRLYRGLTGLGDGAKLLEAVAQGDTAAAERYLAEGASVSYVNEHDQNALLLALEENHFALAHELIRRGSDVSLRSKMNHTPLSMASRRNDTESVRLIIERGFTIDASEKDALLWAVSHHNADMLRALLTSKPDLQALFPATTALEDAARKAGFTEGADLLRAYTSTP